MKQTSERKLCHLWMVSCSEIGRVRNWVGRQQTQFHFVVALEGWVMI